VLLVEDGAKNAAGLQLRRKGGAGKRPQRDEYGNATGQPDPHGPSSTMKATITPSGSAA
jgi:hypothetical protein